jgi:hypothetical protein
MSDPEAAARVAEKPAFAAHHPIELASPDPGRHSPRPCDQGIPVQRGSSRVEDAE